MSVLHGFGDRGVTHVDPVAAAGAADRSIVRPQPEIRKKEIGDVGLQPQRRPGGSSGSL
jgi:hypothetical protein